MTIVALHRSYSARAFTCRANGTEYLLSGTLDGYLDFCITDQDGKHATRTLSLDEARTLIATLHGAIGDVQEHCQYDRDPLLIRGGE